MKALSTLFQILALAACLAANLHLSGEFQLTGMRRAIQAVAEVGGRKLAVELVHTGDAGADL